MPFKAVPTHLTASPHPRSSPWYRGPFGPPVQLRFASCNHGTCHPVIPFSSTRGRHVRSAPDALVPGNSSVTPVPHIAEKLLQSQCSRSAGVPREPRCVDSGRLAGGLSTVCRRSCSQLRSHVSEASVRFSNELLHFVELAPDPAKPFAPRNQRQSPPPQAKRADVREQLPQGCFYPVVSQWQSQTSSPNPFSGTIFSSTHPNHLNLSS